MRVGPLIPVVAFLGITFHSCRGLRSKFAEVMKIGERVKAKEQLVIIMNRLERRPGQLEEFAGTTLNNQIRWIKAQTFDINGKKMDLSVDPWGTTLGVNLREGRLSLVSAGPDKAFGTFDDIKDTRDTLLE